MPKPKQCSYDKEPAVCSLTFTDLTSGKLDFRANLCADCLQEMKTTLRGWSAGAKLYEVTFPGLEKIKINRYLLARWLWP